MPHLNKHLNDKLDFFHSIFFSMGGAIAVHAAKRGLIPSLGGLVVIDVVEG